VQNGVLKALSFMFEYIGEMGKDYVYAVTPLLEDALMDRDLVHRQTACAVVKHLALGVAGLGCEDAIQHLMNYVWPNIFETPRAARRAARPARAGGAAPRRAPRKAAPAEPRAAGRPTSSRTSSRPSRPSRWPWGRATC